MKAWVNKLINRAMGRFGYKVNKIQKKPDPIHPWEEENLFNDKMKQVGGFTLVDKTRCFMLYQFARQASNLQGDVAEVGVYRGGTARLLAKTFDTKNLHLFDTFAGMPPTDANLDAHKEGDFGDSPLQKVKAYLIDCKNIHFHQGIFPATAKPVENLTFCLVHVDADIYKSVRDCCIFFYPRMEKGGLMVFDDYGFLSCPGAKKAVDEFFLDKPEKPCYLPTGQCVVIRL